MRIVFSNGRTTTLENCTDLELEAIYVDVQDEAQRRAMNEAPNLPTPEFALIFRAPDISRAGAIVTYQKMHLVRLVQAKAVMEYWWDKTAEFELIAHDDGPDYRVRYKPTGEESGWLPSLEMAQEVVVMAIKGGLKGSFFLSPK